MKLLRLTLAAAAGGLAANYFLNKGRAGRANGGGEAADTSGGARGAADPAASTSASSAGTQGSSASLSDSPNAAERLRAARPANSLAGSGGQSLGLLGSDSREGAYATSTGLSDFARGA